MLATRWQSNFGGNVSTAEVTMKGTPGVMMWVLNVIAIFKPTKSDRWLSVVFDSLLSASENLFFFLWNKQFCICFCSVCMCCVCLSHNIIYFCVCCTVEVWQRGWIDCSADRGQLLASGGTSPFLTPQQQQQVIHIRQSYCYSVFHIYTSESRFKFSSELWFVCGMKPRL